MEPIRIKDLRWINLLSVGAILLMLGAMIWNITNHRIGWATADFIIACFNGWALYFSISTHRDLRVEIETIQKEAKK